MRKYIITFILGFLVASCIAGIFIYSSIRSASNYKDKYSELEKLNSELRESDIVRQSEIERLRDITIGLESENSRLESINSKYASDIRERQRIVSEARESISGSEDAIGRLEIILELFSKLE